MEYESDPYAMFQPKKTAKKRSTLMQTILPIIPADSTIINNTLTVTKKKGEWTYHLSLWPMYNHKEEDQRSFRLVCALLLNAGICRQCELVKTFGIQRRRLNRAQKQLRKNGISSFFRKSKGRTGGHIFTSEMIRRAQELLHQGLSRGEAAKELGIEYSTFSKAISSKRLIEAEEEDGTFTTQSQRALEDVQAAEKMGTACTQTGKRIAASFGLTDGVETKFRKCLDVPNGGVLCALPALLENGLLSRVNQLGSFEGYYSVAHILLVLSFMLLSRIENIEQLRKIQPGEFGKLIGIDRIPEARCLRSKMKVMTEDSRAE